MGELARRVLELRRATNSGQALADLRAHSDEWRLLQTHPEYATAPPELQALILASLARALRAIALASNQFAPFDEAIALLRQAQRLSRDADPGDHIEYRLDEARFRYERFGLSHDRRDVWEAYICSVRFGVVAGGNVHSIGDWVQPGPLQWGNTSEECDFDGAECRYLVGKTFRASYEVFDEGEDLDLAIGFFEVSIPQARFDWHPLRQYAADLAEALVERFWRCHQKPDAFAALEVARRAITEIAPGDKPSSEAIAALARALTASHAAGAPKEVLREAITYATELESDPRMQRLGAIARLVLTADRHLLSWWLSSPPAEIALGAGEHLLWRFRITDEIPALESALKTLRFALRCAKTDADRSLINCRLAEGRTHRAISIPEDRRSDSDKAVVCARAAKMQAGEDAALQIQADFALGEALTAPFRPSHDPTQGMLGMVFPPGGNIPKAEAAYEAAARNAASKYQWLAIVGAVRWSEIALEFRGWPETADAMRHALVAFERFLARRPCRVEVVEALQYLYGHTRRAAFALAAVGDFAGAIAVIERGRGVLRRSTPSQEELEEWTNDWSLYAADLIHEASQRRDEDERRKTEEEKELEIPPMFNMRPADERGAEASWAAQVREGRLQRSPMRQRVLRDAARAAENGPVVYLIPETWGLILLVNRKGEITVLWPNFFRHVEVIGEVRAFYADYELRHQNRERFKLAFDRLAAWMWDSVVRHILPVVRPERRIVIVPTGMTSMLPFASARAQGNEGSRQPHMLDELAITYAPTVGVFLAACDAANQRSAASALIVDEPTNSRPRFRLSGSERSVVQHFIPQAKVLHGREADLARVSKEIASQDVIHFSAHGEADLEDPMQSGIVLADDQMLSAERFSGGVGLEKTRLAAISACESAMIGPRMPEESIGLAMALLMARIPGVLGPLWSVGEHDAFFVMLGFYRAWIGEKIAPASALQCAQIWVRDSTNDEKRKAMEDVLPPEVLANDGTARLVQKLGQAPAERAFTHPIHWAAFVFNGA